ncbi:hypothetical protein [Clostridium isatidis]|uniref:Uncharacterized protein n=1 Tax=Clostridium isatidis TaxID=182773 RepID=A0A343JBE6_9CLOT|nr:hypothetical protein [Clostridium isatidis]ASW42854.1 hypothetical protein BEN51_05030 [Clostridium isatidis]
MIKEIILKKIINQGIDSIERKINKVYFQNNNYEKWEKSFSRVGEYSECITKEACIELSRHRTIRRYYYLTFDTSLNSFPMEDFIIALAMEFKDYNIDLEINNIIGLGEAFIEEWKSEVSKDVNCRNVTCFNNSKAILNKQYIISIIEDSEKLIRKFYNSFEEVNGLDIIRVYYREPGKTWLEHKPKYSVEISVNLNKGLPLGFTRIGYDYELLHEESAQKLKVSYLSEDNKREVLRINRVECPNESKIIWAY